MAPLRSFAKCYEKEIGRRIIMGMYMFVGGLALFVLGMEFMCLISGFVTKYNLRKAGLLETEQRYRRSGGKSSLLYTLKEQSS